MPTVMLARDLPHLPSTWLTSAPTGVALSAGLGILDNAADVGIGSTSVESIQSSKALSKMLLDF